MLEDEVKASNQLHEELEDSIATGFSNRRPILTHLNADTTWLLSLPYPEESPRPSGRQRFNILIDPWLTGPQSDVARWFSTQWHNVKSSIQSISELNGLLEAREASPCTCNSHVSGSARWFIDAVVISHEFTDHCHQATLQEIPASVPVFATTKAAELIRSWKHFKQVSDMALFGGAKADWRTTSRSPLPQWLGIARLVTPGDALYYHSAIVICFQILDKAESVIYTPHGVEAATFRSMHSADPFVHNLAFLHGLHDVSIWLTKQLNLGAFNAVEAARLLNSQYWVGTHDEVKKGGGLIAPFLRRKAWSLTDVWSKEDSKNSKKQRPATTIENNKPNDPAYIDLRNGESLVLD